MTCLVQASCPVCGRVQLTTADIRLVVCGNPDLSYYEFGCPHCGEDVRKPADDHVISLLLSGGVVAHCWDAAPRPSGPALTEDDLIAFGQEIEAADMLAAVSLAELAHR